MTKLSKVNQRWFSIGSIFFVATTLLLTSCAKDPGKIGLIIQPEDSYLDVRYTDTTSVYAYSVLDDSVRSDELTRNSIGVINDPVFGFTKASFYTQFAPETNGHDFGEQGTRVLDSLVLQLVYSGAYGDTNTQLTIHTFEMTEDIYRDSIYYSHQSFDIGSDNYSNFTFMPRPNDSVEFDGDTLVPLIRINLSDLNPALAEKLLNADTTEMEDLELFQEFFKGLYLVPEDLSSTGTLAYFDLTQSLSKMTIYYGSSYDGTFQDSLQFDYLISTSMARINKYEHDYTNASSEFRQQAISGDTALGKQVFYAQGYAGVKTIVKVPFPEAWRKLKNVAVNEARLIFPGYSGDQFYGAPSKMALVMALEDGGYDFMSDQYEGDDYFGGYYESESNHYVFRITRYIQSLISDSTTTDLGLYLFVNSGSVNPESFIFDGFEPAIDTAARMKLQIIYTDLD
jgi:hypothetical protein